MQEHPVLQIIETLNSRDLINQFEDGAAAETRVGHILERTTDEDGRKAVQPHSTAGEQPGMKLIALRYPGTGMEAAGAEEYKHQFGPGDTYSKGNLVRYISANQGVVLNLILADDETVNDTDFLTSNGNGELRSLDQSGGETKADAFGQVVQEGGADSSAGSTTFVEVEVL